MSINRGILADESFPRSDDERFAIIITPLQDSTWTEFYPSEGEESMRLYERIWLLQACVEELVSRINTGIGDALENGKFPSHASVQVEDTIHEFLKREWLEKGQQALLPAELQVVIDETIRQVEAQWIAWFNYWDDDLLWTTLHFMRA